MNKKEKEMRLEAREAIIETLKNGYSGYYCDLHNEVFNTDYYIVDTYEAKKALEEYGVFDAIGKIQKYEEDNFGKVYTDLSDSEKVINMLYYIISEEVLFEIMDDVEVLNENRNNQADKETNAEILKAIEERKMFERLTHRSKYGIAYTKIAANESNMVDVGECYTGRIIDRLAAYEDSGLSPEEVQELAQAKSDGRLIEFPCKIGDTVYVIYGKSKILETTVDKRAWTDDDGYMLRTKEGWFKEKDIGKTVFLTCKEAEKAIGG